jgi:SP family sugar:H+ symporter-like MFS transporter
MDGGHGDNLPTEGSRTYAIIVCIFGYDQGVTSGVLVMHSFLNDYRIEWHGHTYEKCTGTSSELPTR